MPRSLYLHVPFCPIICPYCDFHKMKRGGGLVEAYLGRLEEEARALHAEFPTTLDTIYLGGGTPSVLSDEELARVVGLFEKTWGWPAREETTLEADPLTFDGARLEAFRALGVSRLSIGLQSTQDGVLGFLGRRHNGEEGLAAVEMALAAGFEVSADLITAVPSGGDANPEQDAQGDLHALAATGVPHVSVYTLTIEENTPFHRRGVAVDPDREAADYALAGEVLAGYGLRRYEVSSHARPCHESRHNQAYWRMDHYLALGPSASAFVPGAPPERRVNRGIKGWLAGEAAERIPVSPQAFAEDALMAGLRTRLGVDLGELARRSSFPVLGHYRPLIARLVGEGLLELEGVQLRATETGLWQLDGIVRAFFDHPNPRQPA
ncbi:radical SAM family heme chaperone HemW [soil metagenome]